MRKIYENTEALCVDAAARFVKTAERAIESRGWFAVALSGGATPKAFFEELAKPHWQQRLDWTRILLFWGDERFVPVDDQESNQKMAKEALVERVKIPAGNVFPVQILATPEQSAAAYEAAIRQAFSGPPCFDLILLGLGTDGHTASLFPGTKALLEEERLVCAVKPLSGGVERITLTYPVLNAARQIWFLVTGSAKAGIVSRVLSERPEEGLPACRIRPSAGDVFWLLDRPAAGRLVE